MNRRIRRLLLTTLLLTLTVSGPAAFSAEEVAFERIGSRGLVDWIDQRVSATGIGIARVGAPPGQARTLAERAALTVARRNLLEAVRGVHVDSTTTVENFMVADDAIVARVSGVVRNARVDRVEHLSDGSVQTTVSMPLTGNLGAIVFNAAAGSEAAPPEGGWQQRIEDLEKRVLQLEERIDDLSRTALQQQETIEVFRRFVEAWTAYIAARPVPVAAGQEADLQELRRRLQAQEERLAEMARRLDRLAVRFDENAPAAPPEAEAPARPGSLYTGLVVDARGTGFFPCLKPEIFAGSVRLYPGASVDLQTAVRVGYVRYYRQLDRAQQSDRVGSLPLTVRAKGTAGGERSLELEPAAFDQVKAVADDPAGILRKCRVVIVF